MIDDKGKCCGRKPTAHKGQGTYRHGRKKHCPHCDRYYDYDTGAPTENYTWAVINGAHVRKGEA